MTLRIKICGITNINDALEAVNAGAEALGFMLYEKSKRFVRPETVKEIIRELPPFVSCVGVFVNESRENILSVKESCQLDTIQLHGDESPTFCQEIPGKVIKAFQLRTPETLNTVATYQTNAWLLDSYSPAARGGTGDSFNWDWVKAASPLDRPVIIAGGLTPDNAADCVLATRPYGLDVSSGVEISPGIKCAKKMTDFVTAAREAASRFNNDQRTELLPQGTPLADRS